MEGIVNMITGGGQPDHSAQDQALQLQRQQQEEAQQQQDQLDAQLSARRRARSGRSSGRALLLTGNELGVDQGPQQQPLTDNLGG